MVDGSDLFNKGVMNQWIVADCLGDVEGTGELADWVDAGTDGPSDDCPVNLFSVPTR